MGADWIVVKFVPEGNCQDGTFGKCYNQKCYPKCLGPKCPREIFRGRWMQFIYDYIDISCQSHIWTINELKQAKEGLIKSLEISNELYPNISQPITYEQYLKLRDDYLEFNKQKDNQRLCLKHKLIIDYNCIDDPDRCYNCIDDSDRCYNCIDDSDSDRCYNDECQYMFNEQLEMFRWRGRNDPRNAEKIESIIFIEHCLDNECLMDASL